MKDRTTDQINFKCPSGLMRLIEKDIDETDEFRNRSEWIVAALRYYLEMRENQKEKRNTQDESLDFISTPESSVSNKNDLKEC